MVLFLSRRHLISFYRGCSLIRVNRAVIVRSQTCSCLYTNVLHLNLTEDYYTVLDEKIQSADPFSGTYYASHKTENVSFRRLSQSHLRGYYTLQKFRRRSVR